MSKHLTVLASAVAGLKGHIPATELDGRLAVAILNLKPAKLAGMASEAMLLAADAPNGSGTELVRILTPPGMLLIMERTGSWVLNRNAGKLWFSYCMTADIELCSHVSPAAS